MTKDNITICYVCGRHKAFCNTCSNYSTLVLDLQAIYNWSQEWLLPLNVEKCVTLHVGSKNPRLVYSVGNDVLSSTVTHNDLEILITNNLSWSDQVVSVTKRANRMLYILSKLFSKTNHLVFAKLCGRTWNLQIALGRLCFKKIFYFWKLSSEKLQEFPLASAILIIRNGGH